MSKETRLAKREARKIAKETKKQGFVETPVVTTKPAQDTKKASKNLSSF